MKTWDLSFYSSGICDKGILVRELKVTYNRKGDTVLLEAAGPASLTLSDGFVEKLEAQLIYLKERVVLPLLKFSKCNFEIIIAINLQGNFNFNNMQIHLKPDMQVGRTVKTVFHESFKVLTPFIEYLDIISVRGFRNRLKLIHGTMTLGIEDLEEVIDFPIIGPTATNQWYNFLSEANNEVRKHYRFDVEIPIFEGEVTWKIQNRYIRFHHLETEVSDAVGE